MVGDTAEGGPDTDPCRGEMGVGRPERTAVEAEFGGRPADTGLVGVLADAARGEVGDFMNMDFVPSTKRPPRGGPFDKGGAKDDCEGAGEEGPAPGD